jgi:hypothetical protein
MAINWQRGEETLRKYTLNRYSHFAFKAMPNPRERRLPAGEFLRPFVFRRLETSAPGKPNAILSFLF